MFYWHNTVKVRSSANLLHAGVSFKDMIPFQLAKMSVLKCEFKDRDREQDGMVRMLVSLALVLTLETSDTKDNSLALTEAQAVEQLF